MKGLEVYSHKPKHLRKAEYDIKLVKQIEKIRREHPTYSAKKIKHILLLPISIATIGRIIKRYDLYFVGKDIKVRIERHKKHNTNRIDITKRVSVHISSSSKSSQAVIAL